MSIYYVYMYLREDGTPYYIGKGMGRCAYKKHTSVYVPKDQTRIVFVKENLSDFDAKSMEVELIAKFGRKNNCTGILRNLTDGGEGSTGYIPSKSALTNLSNALLAHFASPGAKEAQSIRIKNYFKTPGAIEKHSSAMKIAQNKPETRAKNSTTAKKKWSDPVHRERMIAAAKAAWVVRKSKK